MHDGSEPFPGYRLRTFLGRGGYADVWESTSPCGLPVALKFMRVDDQRAATQEVRAIQSMKRLHHPYLIRMYDVWSVPGYVVFSMELADGSLHDLLQAYFSEYRTAIPPDMACIYLAQVAEAIDFLNGRNHNIDGQRTAFVHGDVKPSNMLVVGDTVKLADFGMATPLTSGRCQRTPLGTTAFAAPEIFHGWITDRADQYALAASYCLIRGGKLPFRDSPESFRTPYTRPTPDLRMLPEPERPIIAKALAPIPCDRFPNCASMIDALASLSGFAISEPVLAR
ncbi:MAG: serine/threonine-protein kinase [Gemmataceae bacterium]